MKKKQNMLFIHGLYGSSQGVKATLLRSLFPDLLTPDFNGSLEERMTQLAQVSGELNEWIIIGSSFGGLMAALFTCAQPQRVRKLVLLAPALIWPDFAQNLPDAVQVPTTIYHGEQDTLIPISTVKPLAVKVFQNLIFHTVDDDHGLHKTVHAIDWHKLLLAP